MILSAVGFLPVVAKPNKNNNVLTRYVFDFVSEQKKRETVRTTKVFVFPLR